MKVRTCSPLLACVVMAACNQHAPRQNQATEQILKMAAALRSGQVETVETLHLPLRIETYARVTPETLKTTWLYKTTFRYVSQKTRNSLADALLASPLWQADQTPDLRQGVLFYSSNGSLLGGIYFDHSGNSGAVNEIPVRFARDLLNRIQKTLPLSLE